MAPGHLRSSCRYVRRPNGTGRVWRGEGTPSRSPHYTSPTKNIRVTFTSPLRASCRFGIMGPTWPSGARWLITDGRDPIQVHSAQPPPVQHRQPSFLHPPPPPAHFVIAPCAGLHSWEARATFSSRRRSRRASTSSRRVFSRMLKLLHPEMGPTIAFFLRVRSCVGLSVKLCSP